MGIQLLNHPVYGEFCMKTVIEGIFWEVHKLILNTGCADYNSVITAVDGDETTDLPCI